MTETSKSNTAPLTVASLVSIVILTVGASALRDQNISQTLFTSVLGLSVALGLFSIAGLVESFMKPALGFESFRWVFVSALAFVGYLSRIDAVNDINAVFHIDASALPLTTVAGTVMRFATYMYWPMAAVFVGSVLMIALMIWGPLLDDKDDLTKIGLGVRVFAAAVSSGLAWLLIFAQLTDPGILAKIYRVAHKADFVSSFNCEGVDSGQFRSSGASCLRRKFKAKRISYASAINSPSCCDRWRFRVTFLSWTVRRLAPRHCRDLRPAHDWRSF
jgi:hypothetical protein